MKDPVIYGIQENAAVHFACRSLRETGVSVAAEPCDEVTHLLLGVPSFDAHGHIRGGGDFKSILAQLPKNITIIGGNLQSITAERTLDLLQDEQYLAENAAITADCAMRIAGNNLPVRFAGCPVLIIGWGRIGKCLAQLLQSMGANVTVAARKEDQRASLISLGYTAVEPRKLSDDLHSFRAIFNTAPQPVLDREQTALCRHDCVLIDLASAPGIVADDVIVARGLPGRDLPEASGELIAKTIYRLLKPKGETP